MSIAGENIETLFPVGGKRIKLAINLKVAFSFVYWLDTIISQSIININRRHMISYGAYQVEQ